MEGQVEIDLKPLQDKKVNANESANTVGKLEERRTECTARKPIEVAVLCIVIILLWGLLSLPGVFSNVDLSKGSEEDTLMAAMNHTGTSSNENTSFCIPEAYLGSVCRTELQTLQTCLFGDGDGEIFIPANGNQLELEQTAQTTIGGLPFLNPSAECSEIAPPFLCFSMFGLCNNQSRELYLPSSQECRTVTENICAEEFVAVGAFVDPNQLPQCDEFPDVSIVQESCSTVNITGTGTVESIVCNDGFYLDEICRPECGVWEAFSYGTYIPIDVTVIVTASVYFISAAILMISSCIRYKHVLKFPSIFIVYGTATLGALEISFLVGYFDRKALFCKSRDLVQSLTNPTPFCKFQGIVFLYAVLLLALFSCFHILSVFWAVMFPFHARSFKIKGYLKYVHLTMLLLALVLPWGAVSVALADGTYGRFPPITCHPSREEIILYGITWPVCIMLASSLSLTAIVLFVIIQILQKKRKEQGSVKSFKALLSSHLLMSTAELKILVTFIYYAIFIGSLLGLSSVGKVGMGPAFSRSLFEYLRCEATGTMPGKVCKRSFQMPEIEIPVNIGLVLFGLYPVVNLLYVLNIKEIKKWVSRRYRCQQHQSLALRRD